MRYSADSLLCGGGSRLSATFLSLRITAEHREQAECPWLKLIRKRPPCPRVPHIRVGYTLRSGLSVNRSQLGQLRTAAGEGNFCV